MLSGASANRSVSFQQASRPAGQQASRLRLPARASASNPAMRGRAVLIASLSVTVVLFLSACVPRDVPPVPAASRDQQASGGGPRVAWRGEGRLEIARPGLRQSVAVWLRVTPGAQGGEVRAALVGDGGVQLADLALADGSVVVHQVVGDLRERAALLATVIGQAYGAFPGEARTWQDDRLRGGSAGVTRWYGGDPLLLRRVEGIDWPLVLADYRLVGGRLIAHEVRAEGPFGSEIRLRLTTASLRE